METESEFAFFGRARALAAHARELISSTRAQVLGAKRVRDDAAKAAGDLLAKATALFDAEQQRAYSQRDKVFSELQAANHDAERLRERCREFLTSQGTEAQEPLDSVESDAPPISDLSRIRSKLDGLRADLDLETKKLIPAFFPRSVGGRWFLAIAAFIVLVNFWPLLVLFPVGVMVARATWTRAAQGTYRDLANHVASIARATASLKVAADAHAQAQVAGAKKSVLEPAKAAHEKLSVETAREYVVRLQGLAATAQARAADLREAASCLWADCAFSAAPFGASEWATWQPDASPEFAARFGVLRYAAPDLTADLQGVSFEVAVPALAPVADGKCMSFVASGGDKERAVEAMRAALIRALATTPAGKARFTFIDPVGQGHNVSDFMRLVDFDKDLVSGKAWSEQRHIEEQMTRLTEHTETVIQKYLRRDFQSILDYNRQANEVAEPFHFLVIFDFPVGFSDSSARRLVSLVRNGARCGVFVMLMRDPAKGLPHGFSLSELDESSSTVVCEGGSAKWPEGAGAVLDLDTTQGSQALIDRIIVTSGEQAKSAMRVEVPFAKVLALGGITRETWWKGSTAARLAVPIGPTGAKKIQLLTLGDGLSHHGLIVGRTGSGKTNLMHVIISAAALAYSPSELQLYLIDFKGGVGFKPYAKHGLPHARVIAIESEREFGLSVLQGLDAEMDRRFEAFRSAGVDNLTAFRTADGAKFRALPRQLLIIDEFQELFSEDDSIAHRSRQILERIVRQGRSFGLHVLLGSQSLAGSGQLPQAVLGQLGVRIALPCNDADAKAVFAHDNGAARSLSRPGEAIYNDGAGEVSSNSPFQVAMIGDGAAIDSNLSIVTSLAHDNGVVATPIVFDGNEPARLIDNSDLGVLIEAQTWPSTGRPRAWLGEPIAIEPPLSTTLERRPGRNLLIVTRDEAEGVGLLYASFLSLLNWYAPTTAKFYVLDLSTSDSPWTGHAEDIREAFKQQIFLLNRHSLGKTFGELSVEVAERLKAETRAAKVTPHFVFIIGLHRARDLRKGETAAYPPQADTATMFESLLRDGPDAGVHFLTWCDTVPNARRSADRGFDEFGLRVGGAMSIDDSRRLFDSADASRLSRPCRLIFTDEEKPGVIRKFRPYALPTIQWLREVADKQKDRRL